MPNKKERFSWRRERWLARGNSASELKKSGQ